MWRIFKVYLFLSLFSLIFVQPSVAGEVKLPYGKLVLNGNLEIVKGKSISDGVILMTHGTLAHNGMEIIRTLQGLLKENGYNSLAINLSLNLNDRHGFYDCATPHTHHHADALDEIGAWLEWLKGKKAGQVVLLGHSRGGNQTAWFAAERSEPLVKAVVLVAPQVWSENYAATDYKTRYQKELKPELDKAQAIVASGKPNQWMVHTDFTYCKDTQVSASAFVSYYQSEPRLNTPNLLPKIKQPVLVFAATEDTIVKGLDKKVAPLADGENIQLVVIDGADHTFRDLYAEDVVDAIVSFLENI
jgi:pimeloyl-ACP methyl ester carboxylesterase